MGVQPEQQDDRRVLRVRRPAGQAVRAQQPVDHGHARHGRHGHRGPRRRAHRRDADRPRREPAAHHRRGARRGRHHDGAADVVPVQGGHDVPVPRARGARRRDAALGRRQLGQRAAAAAAERDAARGRRGRLLPLRLRGRPAQLQVDQHGAAVQDGRADAHGVRARRRPHLGRQRRRLQGARDPHQPLVRPGLRRREVARRQHLRVGARLRRARVRAQARRPHRRRRDAVRHVLVAPQVRAGRAARLLGHQLQRGRGDPAAVGRPGGRRPGHLRRPAGRVPAVLLPDGAAPGAGRRDRAQDLRRRRPQHALRGPEAQLGQPRHPGGAAAVGRRREPDPPVGRHARRQVEALYGP